MMATLAEQRISELDTEFGLEDVDVLDEHGTMEMSVLWDSHPDQTNVSLIVRAQWHGYDGRVEYLTCSSLDVELTQTPLDLAHWVDTDHQVWERCRAEWARYLEQREP